MPSVNNVRDVLVAARELISKPEAWTKGYYARDINGNSVEHNSADATCFCATGAIDRNTDCYIVASDARQVLRQQTPGNMIVCFNDDDSTRHEDILAVFDKAIASVTA